MWFVTKNIWEYLCNEDIPKDKRVKFLKFNMKAVKKIITDMKPTDLISYLFDPKLLNELKVLLCEHIDEISIGYSDKIIETKKTLLNEFRLCNLYKEKYLLSDVCPTIFKKEIIEKIYDGKTYDVVKKGKESNSIKKVILKLDLSKFQLVRLLNTDISSELKDYIVDECLLENFNLSTLLENKNVSEQYKLRALERKVDMVDLFSLLSYVDNSTMDYVLKVKSKEFDEYLNTLTASNILNVINDYNTPKGIVDYLFKHKFLIIEKAISRAWRSDLESTISKEKHVQVLNLIYERRPKAVYRVINKLYDFQLMRFLNLKYLPDEYKDYIIKKRWFALRTAINRLSPYEAKDYLKKDSNVPVVIQKRIFEKKKNAILKYYSEDDDSKIVSLINVSSLSSLIKRMLIQERINSENVLLLLGEYGLDKECLDIVLELKKDIIIDKIFSYDNDKLFKGKFDLLKEEVAETLLMNCEDMLKQRVNILSKDELQNYLKNEKVLGCVKQLILERLGVETENINYVLTLINMYDVDLVLNNFANIQDLICGLGIDFNSFLQYGSGSKKYSQWLVKLSNIINSDDIGDFAMCKNYLFNNYYNIESENGVYLIQSFLEYVDNYNTYKQLFINLIKDRVKLNKEAKDSLRFLFNINDVGEDKVPKSINELKKFKLELYKNYLGTINGSCTSLDTLKNIFNNVLFCDAQSILINIGGTGALRTLKKDNINSFTMVKLVDELMLYSSIIEMVNYTNNIDGLKNVLNYVFSDIDVLTKIQNMFSSFEDKVRKVYELDSVNNLTTLSEARRLDLISNEYSSKYGGEVFDFTNKNYCLYGHVLSRRENIVDIIDGVSSGKSNFISVSPVSYRGQKYYWDRDDVIVAYDKLPRGSFICSSISNMGTNYTVKANSSEVGNISRSQRGILETSAVVERNSEALLYREGLRPCGLILPGGRLPTKIELEYHEKYNLPFIITQEVHKAIDNPEYVFDNNLKLENTSLNLVELENIMEMLKPNVVHVKENDLYTGREVAVFADCHAMYEPTVAILEDIKRRGITEIYSLGDNVGLGPNPAEVFDLLEEFGVKSVAGNAEYYNSIGTEPFPYLTDARLDNQLWTERKLGPSRIGQIRLYPASIDLFLGNQKIALCHFANDVRWDFRDRSVHTYVGYNGSNVEQLRYTNSEDAIRKITNCIVSNQDNLSLVKGYIASREEPIFGGKKVTDYNCVLQGHYHFQLKDTLDDTEIYTLRAVGMGYEGLDKDNEACYYILRERKDGQVDIIRTIVKFNKNALISSIHTCDLPSKSRVLSYVKKSR